MPLRRCSDRYLLNHQMTSHEWNSQRKYWIPFRFEHRLSHRVDIISTDTQLKGQRYLPLEAWGERQWLCAANRKSITDGRIFHPVRMSSWCWKLQMTQARKRQKILAALQMVEGEETPQNFLRTFIATISFPPTCRADLSMYWIETGCGKKLSGTPIQRSLVRP